MRSSSAPTGSRSTRVIDDRARRPLGALAAARSPPGPPLPQMAPPAGLVALQRSIQRRSAPSDEVASTSSLPAPAQREHDAVTGRDTSSDRAGGRPIVVQRLEHEIEDADVEYGAVDPLRTKLTVFTKDKGLYKAKNKSAANLIVEIPAGKPITILETPTGGKFERTWAKVEVNIDGKKRGYVNTSRTSTIEDHPLTHAPAGVIMSKEGPQPEDIEQHTFGDCFLLAALMSLTRRDPGFVQTTLFATDPTEPAERHTLRFHADKSHDGRGPFETDTVTVANTVLQTTSAMVLADGSKISKGKNLGAKGAWNWPAIVEKAYAAWPRRGSLDKLSGGNAFRAAGHLTGDVHEAMSLVFASCDLREKPPTELETIRSGWKSAIQAALSSTDRMITASTRSNPSEQWLARNKAEGKGASGELKVGGIAFGHVYEIVAADASKVQIRNPWGRYARVDGKVVEDAAVSVLSWDEFLEVMSDWAVKKKETA